MLKKEERVAQVKLGLVGCGGNMTGHLRRLMTIPDAKIVALADPNPESISRMKERVPESADLPTYYSHERLIKEADLDAIVISSPHTIHYEQIVCGLEAGLHVLTEKPMVCTVEHAQHVISLSKEVDRILMVSYQRHLSAPFRFIRNQIASGELGDVQFVNALQDQAWYKNQQGKWRQAKALSGGGQLNDSGSHLLDIVLWMIDLTPVEVSARMEYFDGEVDINTSMSVRFENGALANFSVVGNGPGPGMWEDITIWGSKGAIYSRNGSLTCKYGGDPVELDALPSRFTSPDQNFVDAILGRDVIQVPASCGLRVIQLTEAAWESAEDGGRPVAVKL
jgi:predicted dehydrogenase